MENNKVKVAVIQESKLTPKSKNPCIHNYTTVRKDSPHGQGGGLLIFIHRSVTFSKQPSSAESLFDPHLGELAIEAEIGNTKLIISNIYIPPASSCSNGYQSSIEHLLTTKDSLILGDFNAHHPVPAEILDVMTRRDDLRKRDRTSSERPRLNKDIQKRISFNGISFSSSKQLAAKFNKQFNTSKLGRHSTSRETRLVTRETKKKPVGMADTVGRQQHNG